MHNAAEVPSLQKREAGRLDRIKVGMSIAEFKTVFPEAYVGGQSGAVVAYELQQHPGYTLPTTTCSAKICCSASVAQARAGQKQVLWFYFRGDATRRMGQSARLALRYSVHGECFAEGLGGRGTREIACGRHMRPKW